MTSNITHRLLRGVLWSLTGSVISRSLMMLASILAGRFLGVADFGRWGTIRSTVDMFAVLLGFAIGVTASKHVAELRDAAPKRAGRILSLAMLMATTIGGTLTIMLWLLAPLISRYILKDEGLASPLRVAAPFIIVNGWIGVFTGALIGFEAFRRIAMVNLIVGVVGVGLVSGLSYWVGLVGTVASYLVFYMIQAGGMGWYLWRELQHYRIHLSLHGLRSELPVLFRFSLPAMLAGSIGGPAVWIVYAYTYRLNGGLEILGLFNAARLIYTLLGQLSENLHQPLLALVAHTGTRDDGITARINLMATWGLGAAVALVPTCLPEVVGLAFGKQYQSLEFYAAVALMSATAYLTLYKQGYGRLILTRDLLWWSVYEGFIWSLVLLIGTYFMTPQFGAPGLAMAFTVAYVLIIAGMAPVYYRLGPFARRCLTSWPALLANGFVLGGSISVVVGIPVWGRLLYLGLAAGGLIIAFRELWKKSAQEKPVVEDCLSGHLSA